MPLLDKKSKKDFVCDIAIIGGGINGVAIARDASLRGLKVFLIEKSDFGSGASSKTSKLIHGGLRYLKNYQLGLVKDSLQERATLLKMAPHLVQLLPFVYPHYSGNSPPFWQKKLGLFIYGLLGSDNPKKHQLLSREEVISIFPALDKKNLEGGMLYYDAEMLDNRIIIENLLSAAENGAIIMNYTKAVNLKKINGKITGVNFKSEINDEEGFINAKVVVNATGAWSNDILAMDEHASPLRVIPSKGVHLVIKQMVSSHALIFNAPQDNRVFFVIPWNGQTLIGTTDTPYKGDPDLVNVANEDIQYLLTAFGHYFPDVLIGSDSIITSFVGLRPLLFNGENDTYSATRDYSIENSASGLVTILGGKYTTHRKIAEDVVDVLLKHWVSKETYLPCQTASLPLYGAENFPLKNAPWETIEKITEKHQISLEQLQRIMETYGKGALDILEIIKNNPEEKEQICPFHPHLYAEITYAITKEKACKIEDWFQRRTLIAYTPCRGIACLDKVVDKFEAVLREYVKNA
jgi:glycerol-3-phosphate dehydrogenase